MKSIIKYAVLVGTTVSLLFVLSVLLDTSSKNSLPGNDARTNTAFEEALLLGVNAIQIEQAMAERKIPPLRPVLSSPGDLTAAKRILVVSSWRTGSSFLGEIIHSAPGVFYSYEPLHFPTGDPMNLIRSVFECRFSSEYLQHMNGLAPGGQEFMSRNRRVWEACHKDRSLCYNVKFVSRLCSYFPIHLVKVVRLRLRELKSLSDGWKVVYLARDPRGTMASRANLTWCQQDPSCSSSERLCQDMKDDLEMIDRLRTSRPDSYHLLKFEDLTANVGMESERLFRFLDLPITLPVKVFLNTHTSSPTKHRPNSDPFSTRRDSKTVASKWRTKLSADRISNITNTCTSVLETLQYNG